MRESITSYIHRHRELTKEEKFVKWLSRIFKIVEPYETAFKIESSSKFYYDLTKSGCLPRSAYKVSELSKASISRIKTRLTENGFISKGFAPGRKCLVPLHPDIAVDLAIEENLSSKDIILEEFKDEISKLNEGWQKNFEKIKNSKLTFPVNSWDNKILYAQLMGWVEALSENRLVILDSESSKYLRKRKTEGVTYLMKSSKIPESYRVGLLGYDEEQPILGYEVLGFPENTKSSGAIFLNHEHNKELKSWIKTEGWD